MKTPVQVSDFFLNQRHEDFIISKGILYNSNRYYETLLSKVRGCLRGVMVKQMYCGIVVCEFELQPSYYVHFRTNILGKRMDSTTTVLPEGWL